MRDRKLFTLYDPLQIPFLQAESDSGISVNLSHFDPELSARAEASHVDQQQIGRH